MTYEVIILGHLHMPLYFIGTFTEYPYLYEGVFSEKCIAPGIEVEKQSQVLEEKLAERCKLAKGRPCVDFKVVDVNGKEGMFSDYVKSGKYNMLEVWACGHCRVVIPH